MSYLEVYKRNLKTYIQIINTFLLKTKQGHIEKVKDAAIALPFKIPQKIQKKDFLTEGKIPIIDQGQSFIAGYTDDNLALIKNVPIIIFGDHTRAIKYVDFPFAQGADGVKMLSPKQEYLPEFFFFQLQSVDLESRGYSRHYKYLLEHEIVGVKNTDLQRNTILFLRHLEKNELKSSTYFNLEVESHIAALQNSSLRISALSNNSKNEESMIQELRQAILQEAVSGKLVPQDPNDEPASELLKKIKAEKERLVKEKKVKKETPLPQIMEEELPFTIPKRWKWVRIGDIADIETGATPKSDDSSYYGGKIPWITSSSTSNLFITSSDEQITEKALRETNCKIFPKNTLIVAMYGQGKTRGQVSELLIEAATNQACAALVFNNVSKDCKDYVKLVFRKIYDSIRELASGGAQPNLNLTKIKNTLVPLPPLCEQLQIVRKVNQLMMLVDELEEKVKENQNSSELLTEAVLKEAFTS